MASILGAIPAYGLDMVDKACEMALQGGSATQAVVLNQLARQTEDGPPPLVSPPAQLVLSRPPQADCSRYDRLLRGAYAS